MRENQLLERDRELAEIAAALARAGRGEGSALLLSGPAGIGKTALCGAARQMAAESSFQVLTARGGEIEAELPWAIVRELFAAPAVELEEGEGSGALLTGAAGLAAPVVTGAGPKGVDPEADALAAAMHGLYWLTSNLAERAPVLLTVDDAHLADPPSVRFLTYLARRVEDLAVIVLAAQRPAEPASEPRLSDDLAGPMRLLAPSRLSEAGAAALIARELGREPDQEFAGVCHEVTAGNPYFVGELAHQLRREGVEPRREQAARVQQVTPEGLSRAILLRLARFPPSTARLAEAVAIQRSGARLADSAALAGIDADAAAEAAATLASADILGPGVPLRFAHPIVQAAVHEEIPAARLGQLHLRAAELLRGRGAPAEELAVHLLHAEPGADPTGAETLREAARGSLARGVPESSVEYLRRALSEPISDDERPALLLELAEAEAATGSAEVLERLADALEIAEEPRERAEVSFKLGWMLFNAGRLQDAREAFRRGGEELGDADDDLAAVLRTASFGMGLLIGEVSVGELEPFMEQENAAGARTRAARRELLTQVALAHTFASDDSDLVRSLAERALGEGEMLEEQGVSLTFSIAASCLIWADALDPAEREIDRALDLLAERGDALGTAYVRFGRSWVCHWRGRVAEAAADAETAVRAWSGGGRLAGQLPGARYWQAVSLLELDQAAAAEEALGEDPQTGEGLEHYRLWWQIGLARVALAQGQAERARECLGVVERAAGQVPFFHSPATFAWRSDAAIASLRLGDGAEARRLASEELELARRFGSPRAVGIALRALGMVEGGTRGVELAGESVSTLERSPSRIELCRSLVDLGAVQRRAGAPAQAQRPLGRGLELAHELGALALERRAREELTAAGARPRRAQLTGPESLTPSERRVSEFAVEGMTNRQIAEQLFVSLRTVETHLTHAYQKLDISSRGELGETLAAGRR